MTSVNDNSFGAATAESDGVNTTTTEAPASLKNVNTIFLPPPSPAVPASRTTEANAVPLTPMTPASNLRGSGDTLSVPRAPVAERFRRRVEHRGGGDASTQHAATESDYQPQLSQRQTMLSQTYSGGSGDSGRSYKEMLDAAKALHTSADKLQDRICQLHCKFADVILKSALLFDPATVAIVGSGNGIPADLPSPTSAHFTRQEVDDNYERLVTRFINENPRLEKK